jgi:oligopeptide/dipeptide ABC transporter ATP-binding protein
VTDASPDDPSSSTGSSDAPVAAVAGLDTTAGFVDATPTSAGQLPGVAPIQEVVEESIEAYMLPGSEPILEVRDLVKVFPIRGGVLRRPTGGVQAVSGISFTVGRGQTVGVVGESGCGKSTMGRLVLRLIEATSGSVTFDGKDVLSMNAGAMKQFRRRAQIVFQDPYASLNPRMTVRSIIGEPLDIAGWSKKDIAARVKELMGLVGLNPEYGNRFPHEFSGGQRQRIGIARAISTEPELLVLDEPVSALDVSIQAGVVNLLEDIQDRLGLSYVFIAHDLSVVRHISDVVAVMYLGKIVEIGPANEVYELASHPYTQALLSAVPVPDPRKERLRTRIVLEGDVPSPANPPSGCRFRTRCWKAQEICSREEPVLEDRGQGHPVACHFAEAAEVV